MANISEIADRIKPYVMRWIIDVVGDQQATATTFGINLNKILLYDQSIGDYNEFPITNSGLSSALSSSASGDIIHIPPGTIAGDHTITDGVKVVGLSRYATILSGQITGGDGASIENLSIERSANDASTLKGIVDPASGTFRINGCDIEVDQSGSGNAYALSMDGSGIIEVWNSYVYANSGSGTGIAGYIDAASTGTIYIYGGRAQGSSQEFNN